MMVPTTHLEPIAKRFLLLTISVVSLFLYGCILPIKIYILSSVKIDRVMVPEVVAIDCTDTVLECGYSGAGNDVTVMWLHNGSQVYEWKRGADPRVSGVLEGRIDLTHANKNDEVDKRVLHIVELSLELNGEYTCVIRSRGQEVRATKTMTVFSPERDFELTFNVTSQPEVIDILCVAKRLYPQPDLMIEYSKAPIAQQQRTWREGAYFDAESRATLNRTALRGAGELACRLHLPQVDYTAITSKYLHLGNSVSSSCLLTATASIITLSLFLVHNQKQLNIEK